MHIHFTCCDSQGKSTGQLSWFRHWECDWKCDWEWKVARVARPLASYIIISAPKRLIWVWRTFRFRFDCSKVRNDRPSVPAFDSSSACQCTVGRPWHHKLQTDSRLPLQRRQLRSDGDSDSNSNGRRASATASFFFSRCESNGFQFHGQCQRRVPVPSRVESESESESGRSSLCRAPLKLDAICVQLGYANLPERSTEHRT